MKQMFMSMLADGVDGSLSSKRVITLAAFIACLVGFFSNLFFGMKIDSVAFDAMKYIVISGLGFTASEKFSPK